jgi:hypothetical protein
MNRARNRAFAMVAAALGATLLFSADDQTDRASLRTLDGVRVAVEELPAGISPEFTKEFGSKGLSKDGLRDFVEARLAAAHVPILQRGEYPVGDPFLRVTITATDKATADQTAAESGNAVGYRVDLDFVQIVFLRRDPALTFNRATTWAAKAHLGLTPRGQIAERVKKDLSDEVDQFIAAYKSANPN